jgi:hypothetical protein
VSRTVREIVAEIRNALVPVGEVVRCTRPADPHASEGIQDALEGYGQTLALLDELFDREESRWEVRIKLLEGRARLACSVLAGELDRARWPDQTVLNTRDP